jgi:hypothetical protein
MRSEESRVFGAWIGVSFLMMCALCVIALWMTSNTLIGMYGNTDGEWAAWNVQTLVDWSTPFDLSPFNPFAGMGTLLLPNLPWLNPGAWPFGLPIPQDLKYAGSYAIYFLEVLVSSYTVFRTIGATRVHAALAAQLIAFIFPPFSYVLDALSWFSLAPVNAHLMAMCNFALIALLRIGEGGWRKDLLWLCLLVASAISAFTSAPITILTYIPLYAVLFVSININRGIWRRPLQIKLVVIFAMIGLLFATGAIKYISTTSTISARSEFSELIRLPEILTWAFWESALGEYCTQGRPQFLLCPGRFIFLQFAAFVGAIAAAWLVSSLRAAAFGFLVFMLAVQVYGPLSVARITPINASFFVWSAVPLICFFAVCPIVMVLELVPPSGLRSFGALLVAPAAMVIIWFDSIAPTQPGPPPGKQEIGILPPAATQLPAQMRPIFNELGDVALLRPGDRFRGRATTYVGDRRGWLASEVNRPRGFATTVAAREYLQSHFGTSFQETDLWSRGIPTFDEYGQWVTRPAQRLAARLLARPDDLLNLHPSFLRVYELNLPILRMLGVGYLITDAKLDEAGLTLRSTRTSAGAAGPMYLYTVEKPNLANYSPTKIVVSGTYDSALDELAAHASELDAVGVAFQSPAGPLVRASESELYFIRDGWRLKARSTGRSVIAVPIQFSHCWSVSSAPVGLRLYRGNVVETFVEFEGSIDIEARLQFGLGRMKCREADVEELSDAAVGG